MCSCCLCVVLRKLGTFGDNSERKFVGQKLEIENIVPFSGRKRFQKELSGTKNIYSGMIFYSLGYNICLLCIISYHMIAEKFLCWNK